MNILRIKRLTFICCFIFLLTNLVGLTAQVNLKNKQAAIDNFVKGYNTQNFKEIKKSFAFLARLLVKEKVIMAEAFSPRYEYFGKISELGSPKKIGKKTYVFPVIYNGHTSAAEYLYLTFTKRSKIISFRYSFDNIVYPDLDASLTINKLVEPYRSFVDHDKLQLSIGVFKDNISTFHTFKGDATSTTPTDSTIYQIGSISKIFTGVLLANSINHGYVDSLDILSKYLNSKITFNNVEPNLLHLAQHTSGLPREPNNLKEINSDKNNPFAEYSITDLNKYLEEAKLIQIPGEKYEYSNLGFGLLGHLLASNRNSSYDGLLQKEICNPLKMYDTGTTPDSLRCVQSYFGGKATVDFTFQEPFVGAGGIYSSARDMLTFIKSNISATQTKISDDLLLASVPRKINNRLTMGLAWDINTINLDGEKIDLLQHSGNTRGTSSIILISKKKNIGIVLLANSGVPVDKLGISILKGLISDYF